MIEDPYRSIVESAEDPIFISDAEGRYLYVNVAAAANLGMTPETMTGMTVEELFPPHVAAVYRAGVKHVIDSGVTLKSEDRSEVGGVEAWFSTVLQPLRDADGRVTAVQAIVRDITSRKHVEQALLASEERLTQVLRASNIGIFDHNLVTHLGYWSPRQRAIWGVSADEPILLPAFLDAIHPEDVDRVRAAIDAVHQGHEGGLVDLDHRIVRRDGTERWINVSARTVFEGDGERRGPVRTVGATRDITAEKKAEAERAELQAQLQQSQKLESIGHLAGGIAHDFNNILSIIIGCAEMAEDEADPAVVRQYLDEILKASKRSADLTRQLLGFARRQTALPRVVDLNDFVSASLKMLRRLIGEHVGLSWHPGVDLWQVRIDPVQIDQVLVNLIVNARDAIADVGDVVIHTENVPADMCAHHAGLPPGEYVRLAVVDNGKGMDVETQRHLFEPFYTTKGPGQGTGLGMASVHGIVRQNNGAVMVTSGVGQGTTVSVFLPRVAAAVTTNTVVTATTPRGGTETVLVVEDEPQLLRLAIRSLENEGYTVLSASSPDEAIAIAGRHAGSLDLLVTDVIMPGMNGRSLAERLVATLPNLKCLFMSGYTDSVMNVEGQNDAHVHFLQKPFSPDALAAKVRRVLEA